MTERLAFTDTDDHTLLVQLAPGRMQLAVVDCRPSLEAGELRRFVHAVFRAYAAAPLADQLGRALDQLAALRDQLTGQPALRRQLDAARRAIADVRGELTRAPERSSKPEAERPAEPAAKPKRRKPARRWQLREPGTLDWGWRQRAASAGEASAPAAGPPTRAGAHEVEYSVARLVARAARTAAA